jgi:hypothetical protein
MAWLRRPVTAITDPRLRALHHAAVDRGLFGLGKGFFGHWLGVACGAPPPPPQYTRIITTFVPIRVRNTWTLHDSRQAN